MEVKRCHWAKSEWEIAYHDNEWGIPLHDDQKLYELLVLEGMQAGLSWNLILKKRDGMRKAFDGFQPEIVAAYSDEKLAQLLENPDIIRNKAKIKMARTNAIAFLEVQKSYGSFDAFIWSFTNGQTIVNHPSEMDELPAKTDISELMSKKLYNSKFKFVGPTVCYAYMQSIGMVNDHMVWCSFR